MTRLALFHLVPLKSPSNRYLDVAMDLKETFVHCVQSIAAAILQAAIFNTRLLW
jgi:hypothetical protein